VIPGILEFIVLIVGISAVREVCVTFAKNRAPKGLDTVLSELQALRQETRQLRQQNNDVILALDTSLHRVEKRLERLETLTPLAPPAADPPEAVRQVSARGL